MRIVVYSKSNCPNCEAAKSLIRSKGWAYAEVSLDREEEREGFYSIAGPDVRQMPQIYVNDERIGGLAGLREWIKWKESQK